MECDQILANLYVGSHPHTCDDIHELHAAGITAVLNLQSDEDCQHLAIDWSRLAARYFALGVAVHRVPIRDFDDDDLRNKLPEAVRALDELLQEGRTVFVHCSAGVNRSPSAVICYLHWVRGLPLDEAESLVRRSHPCSPVMEVIRLATRDRKGRSRKA